MLFPDWLNGWHNEPMSKMWNALVWWGSCISYQHALLLGWNNYTVVDTKKFIENLLTSILFSLWLQDNVTCCRYKKCKAQLSFASVTHHTITPKGKISESIQKNRIEFKIRLNISLVKILWVLNHMHDAVSWHSFYYLYLHLVHNFACVTAGVFKTYHPTELLLFIVFRTLWMNAR